MANTRRATGLPSALARDGVAVPPSPDVAAHNAGEVIGQSVAYHVAALLAPVLQRLVDVQERYACLVCAARVWREHKTAAANALAAAEPMPKMGPVNQSFTEGARGPVCSVCFDPDVDGRILPPPVD